MKCPMTLRAHIAPGGKMKTVGSECIKEKCGGWECEGEGCAIPLIALRLGTIAEVLDEIEKNLHSQSFVK